MSVRLQQETTVAGNDVEVPSVNLWPGDKESDLDEDDAGSHSSRYQFIVTFILTCFLSKAKVDLV